MTTALFLGRFQPVPHLGHMQVIREILAKHDQIIIGLGSSQYAGTDENPLSDEQRREVFELLFADMNIPHDRYHLVPIRDIHDNKRYVAHVKQLTPHFDVVYSGNELVQRLFREKGYEVVSLPRYGGFEGTKLRELIEAGDASYTNMLPGVSLMFLRTLYKLHGTEQN